MVGEGLSLFSISRTANVKARSHWSSPRWGRPVEASTRIARGGRMTAASGEPLVIVWSNCSHVTASMVELPQLIRRQKQPNNCLAFATRRYSWQFLFLSFSLWLPRPPKDESPGRVPKKKHAYSPYKLTVTLLVLGKAEAWDKWVENGRD